MLGEISTRKTTSGDEKNVSEAAETSFGRGRRTLTASVLSSWSPCREAPHWDFPIDVFFGPTIFVDATASIDFPGIFFKSILKYFFMKSILFRRRIRL